MRVLTSFQNVPPFGLDNAGYVPPGQFVELLNLIRTSASAAQSAMNLATHAQAAVHAAGGLAQQAIVRATMMVSQPSLGEGAVSPSFMDPFVLFGAMQLPQLNEFLEKRSLEVPEEEDDFL